MRVGFPWISLESLVRIETYQWVIRDKSAKNFREAFSLLRRDRTADSLVVRVDTGSLMGQAYPDFGLAAINCRLSQSFRSVRSRIEEAGITDVLTLSPFRGRRHGTILRRLGCTAAFLAGGTNGPSSFSEFRSPLLRVACRASTAADSSSAPRRRNRGFYRPISRGNPLDARCDRAFRAVGRPAILELSLYCCSSSSRSISSPSHSSSAPLSSSRNWA
jgi:hypothetical protein